MTTRQSSAPSGQEGRTAAIRSPADARPVDASMDLLNQIIRQPVDPD